MNRKSILISLVCLPLVLLLWELCVRGFGVNELILPHPTKVFGAVRSNGGYLAYHSGITLFEACLGLLCGVVPALLLALLIQMSRTAGQVVYPYAIAFKAIPIVALAPLTELWFAGTLSKVVLSSTVAFFPVFINAVEGMDDVEAERLDLFDAYSASRWQKVWLLRWPTALPNILAGAKIASTLAVVGVIVAEFVASRAGIGYVLKSSSYYLETDLTFAAVGGAAIVGLVLFGAVTLVDMWLFRWRRPGTTTGAGIDMDLNERRVERAGQLLALHKQHDSPYVVNFLGVNLTILPGVFCPTYGEGAGMLAACLDRSEDSILDMGTGSGALAIVAARRSGRVVAADSNPRAVDCARQNVTKLGLSNTVTVQLSDLFDGLGPRERFSLILFNPSFMEGEPNTPLEAAMFDPGYRTLRRFFREASNWLTPSGRILIAFSNAGDVELFRKLIRELHYSERVLAERENGLRFWISELRPEA